MDSNAGRNKKIRNAITGMQHWRGFHKVLPRWPENYEEALKNLGLLHLAKRRLQKT